jgi:hypothetical protein
LENGSKVVGESVFVHTEDAMIFSPSTFSRWYEFEQFVVLINSSIKSFFVF